MGSKALLIVPVCLIGLVVLVVSVSSSLTAQPSISAEAERGRYLVTVAGCADCHSPKVLTANGPVPDESLAYSGHPANSPIPAIPAGVMGPGKWAAMCNDHMTAWAGPWGVSFAANLTSDKKFGLGGWNDAQFIKAMRTGKHRGYGRQILPPMPWFNLAHMSDEDLKAMLAYFKTVPAIANEVPEPLPPAGQ